MGTGASNIKGEKQEKQADSNITIGSRKLEEDNVGLPDTILSSSKSLIEIENPNKIISGFLFEVRKDEDSFLYFFITLKENIIKEMIEKKETVKLFYDSRKSFRMISLNSEERIIKDFTDIGIDSIVVQILESDNIEEKYFLQIMKQFDEFQDLINEKIDIIHSQKNEINFSKGKIEKIEKNTFTYSANVNLTSPGHPIFFEGCTEVIAIQRKGMNSKNYVNFIGPIHYYLRIIAENTQTKKEETEKKGKIEGNKIIYENGHYYIGDIKEGKKHGKGTEYRGGEEIVYEGEWIDDKYEGKGKLIEEYDHYYIGEFKKGKKHGKGIKYHKLGYKWYEGNYFNDKREGKGIEYEFYERKNYEGEFVNDLYEGKGKKYNYNAQLEYSGEWKEGKNHGKGISYHITGKIQYEGDFFDNYYEGRGKYYYYDDGTLQYDGE